MKQLDLIKKSRSYRRFDASHKIDYELLRNLVKCAQFSPNANNLQPLKFIISNTPEMNAKIFPSVHWVGGKITDWEPEIEERPSAYIIILGDKNISEEFGVDHGIAAQSIMLGVVESGLQGCMLGPYNPDVIYENLGLSKQYKVLLTIAIGKPAESVEITDIIDDDTRYYRKDDVHYVPKRKLKDLIIKIE